eukprot:m.105784 g.105784  ORF g.105784 m.105784 type:complete len:167 (-) comp15132_c0_seq2:483-983(-)
MCMTRRCLFPFLSPPFLTFGSHVRKEYVETGRREDGWLSPNASARKMGHEFDVSEKDDLKRYFLSVRDKSARPSLARKASPSGSLSRSGSWVWMTQGKEVRQSEDPDFEERRSNIQRDLESAIYDTWSVEEKRRRRKVVGQNTPWKLWATSHSFGAICPSYSVFSK